MDRPEVLTILFHPRRYWRSAPSQAEDLFVPVTERISISCRFYPWQRSAPTILFFHGNGEITCDYDEIAPLYNGLGINLFVADYRGYGRSGGFPSFTTMMADGLVIFRFLTSQLPAQGYQGPLFVMGRSLGSCPALEIAYYCPEKLAGLIIESGLANPAQFLRLLYVDVPMRAIAALRQSFDQRLRSLSLPLLMLHGELDILIPLSEAVRPLPIIGSSQKEVVVIPGAGHNDIFFTGLEPYLAALRRFILGNLQP